MSLDKNVGKPKVNEEIAGEDNLGQFRDGRAEKSEKAPNDASSYAQMARLGTAAMANLASALQNLNLPADASPETQQAFAAARQIGQTYEALSAKIKALSGNDDSKNEAGVKEFAIEGPQAVANLLNDECDKEAVTQFYAGLNNRINDKGTQS